MLSLAYHVSTKVVGKILYTTYSIGYYLIYGHQETMEEKLYKELVNINKELIKEKEILLQFLQTKQDVDKIKEKLK